MMECFLKVMPKVCRNYCKISPRFHFLRHTPNKISPLKLKLEPVRHRNHKI